MERKHYEAIAKSFERITLIIFAGLVVQSLVEGATLSDTAVISGVALSFLFYAGFVVLLLKS